MGGWNSTVTQDTILTPDVVKEAITIFETYFDKYVQTLDIPPIKIGARGSSYYFKQDIEENPSKSYGDIDYLIQLPELITLENETLRELENRSIRVFQTEFNKFFLANNDESILKIANTYAIVNTSKGPVQIDLLLGLPHYIEWISKRYIPPRNLKGVVLGSLFSAINNTYNIMIGDRGVVIRIQDKKLVLKKRKEVEIITISKDYNNFWKDILFYFSERLGKNVELDHTDHLINEYPGLNSNNIQLVDACLGLIGLAYSLEKYGCLQNYYFPEYSAKDMLTKIKFEYFNVINKQLNHPKFEKAISENAKISKEKFKRDIMTGYLIVNSLL